MNVRDEISLGSIYIGTLIGADLPPARNYNFFTVYGKQGLLGIIMASILFFILRYFIFRESIRSQSQCVRDILLPVAGKTLMFF